MKDDLNLPYNLKGLLFIAAGSAAIGLYTLHVSWTTLIVYSILYTFLFIVMVSIYSAIFGSKPNPLNTKRAVFFISDEDVILAYSSAKNNMLTETTVVSGVSKIVPSVREGVDRYLPYSALTILEILMKDYGKTEKEAKRLIRQAL